ncbi:MAG: ethylbenzene dehydrogenase-related protein [Candidatus Omnitrophota bacterium]
MSKGVVLFVSLIVCLTYAITSYADQDITAQKVTQAPVIDGNGADEVWGKSTEYTTFDAVAKINMALKAVYTDREIFFLVSYPDPDRSVTHKTWEWDKTTGMYKTGPDREDVFTFKWNMEFHPVDLSLQSDNDYTADIWFWKANRSDPVGYADDKFDRVSSIPISKSAEFSSRSGKKMYMRREGDSGDAAAKETLYEEYKQDMMPGFMSATPSGSRADIKAKGAWGDGRWTIEFRRALNTGHNDDVQFDTSQTYLFGVSRYEIAGRKLDSTIHEPLFGCGDVSEGLTLKFGK